MLHHRLDMPFHSAPDLPASLRDDSVLPKATTRAQEHSSCSDDTGFALDVSSVLGDGDSSVETIPTAEYINFHRSKNDPFFRRLDGRIAFERRLRAREAETLLAISTSCHGLGKSLDRELAYCMRLIRESFEREAADVAAEGV